MRSVRSWGRLGMKSKWGIRKLGDLCNISSSKRIFAREYCSKGVPFYRGKEIIEKHKGNAVSTELFISEERYAEIKEKNDVPRIGDILLSSVGTLGVPWLVDEEKFYFKDGNLTWLRVGEELDNKFLYLWLCSPEAKQQIDSKCIGSTQKAITIETLSKFDICIPSIETQRKISNLSFAIISKIVLNKMINDNLEQQIEALLTDFIEEDGTTPVKLGDYLYIKGRIGWKGLKKSEYLPQSNYRIINGETLTKSGIDWNKAGYISEERYMESPEIMLNVGDILLSKDGTIGKIGYVDSLDLPTSVASGIFVIRNNKQGIISTTFIYYLLRSKLFQAFIAARTEGSVIPHLYQKDFMEFEFPLPAPDRVTKFEKITKPMFSQIVGNLNENKVLASLRDSLLPKFMSGELDVFELDL